VLQYGYGDRQGAEDEICNRLGASPTDQRVGGWVTARTDSEGLVAEFIGPVFNRITDLWKWQRANLYTEMA